MKNELPLILPMMPPARPKKNMITSSPPPSIGPVSEQGLESPEDRNHDRDHDASNAPRAVQARRDGRRSAAIHTNILKCCGHYGGPVGGLPGSAQLNRYHRLTSKHCGNHGMYGLTSHDRSTIWIEHSDGRVEVEELPDGRRRVVVHPDAGIFVSRRECVTTYPIDLIRRIVEVKSPGYVCDEISREEDPDYVGLYLRYSVLGYLHRQRVSDVPDCLTSGRVAALQP